MRSSAVQLVSSCDQHLLKAGEKGGLLVWRDSLRFNVAGNFSTAWMRVAWCLQFIHGMEEGVGVLAIYTLHQGGCHGVGHVYMA